jgi:hypothetical protein
VVLDHIPDGQVFNHNTPIAFGIRFSYLEMVISTLPVHLQVCLGNEAGSLTTEARGPQAALG